MEITVVNGANAIARSVVRKLNKAGYSKIKLLDQRPFRGSVYHL
jgi:hypothetical protein